MTAPPPLTLADQQRDMREGYCWGATGIVVSGLVWVTAAIVASRRSPMAGVWTLFIGAMGIFPISNLLDRLLGVRGAHHPTNPLGRLAMESTVWMLMVLPAAWALSRVDVRWVFPAVLMVIGGRYLTFATVYGTRVYWALGAALGATGFLCVARGAPAPLTAAAGGLVEVVAGLMLLVWVRRRGDGADQTN